MATKRTVAEVTAEQTDARNKRHAARSEVSIFCDDVGDDSICVRARTQSHLLKIFVRALAKQDVERAGWALLVYLRTYPTKRYDRPLRDVFVSQQLMGDALRLKGAVSWCINEYKDAGDKDIMDRHLWRVLLGPGPGTIAATVVRGCDLDERLALVQGDGTTTKCDSDSDSDTIAY